MERSLFRILRCKSDSPNVSILLPLPKASAENLPNGILEKLLAKARKRLVTEFEKHKIKRLLSKLDNIPASINAVNDPEGMAIFVNHNFGKILHLPFPVEERLVIGEEFAAHELVRTVNRGINYYTLSLGKSFIRLFEAYHDNFSEINECGFPFVNPVNCKSIFDPGDEAQESRLKDLFRTAGEAFAAIYNQHPMPVVVAGKQNYIELFGQVSEYSDNMITVNTGIIDERSVSEISRIAWQEIGLFAALSLPRPFCFSSEESHSKDETL